MKGKIQVFVRDRERLRRLEKLMGGINVRTQFSNVNDDGEISFYDVHRSPEADSGWKVVQGWVGPWRARWVRKP